MLENFGDSGLSKAQYSLQVKYYNNSTRIGIVRVARDHINILWTSMIFITRITKNSGDEIVLKFRILDNKATLKKIETSLKRKSRIWMCNTIKYFELDEETRKDLLGKQEKALEEIKELEP